MALVMLPLLLLLLCGTAFADLSSKYKNKASLDNNFMLYWTYNATSDMMDIAAVVKATGWVAFGLTKAKSTDMKDYDVCLGYVNGANKVLQDYFTNGHKAPEQDAVNNCVLDEAMESGGITTLKYHKKGNTGDSKDVAIQQGENIVVWAYKNTDDSLSRHDQRGFATITITMASSGEATKLRAFYWKFAVAFLSVATTLFLK